MGFAEKRLTNHPDANTRRGRFNRGAQSRATGADDKHVVGKSFVLSHGLLAIHPMIINVDANDGVVFEVKKNA
jgi:hypothetical protein